MNDAEIRVRCIEAAAQVPGNPNTLQQARVFYEFVMEGAEQAVEGDLTDAVNSINPTETPLMKAVKKGTRK